MSAEALPSLHEIRLTIAGAGSVAPLAVATIANRGGTLDVTRSPGDERWDLVNINYAERFVTKDGNVWTLTDLGWCVHIVARGGDVDAMAAAPKHVAVHLVAEYRRHADYRADRGWWPIDDRTLLAWEATS